VERAEEAARTPVTAAFGDPGVGELTAAGDAVIGRIGELAREMRLLGSRVGAGELLTAIRGLDHVDPTSREDVRLALSIVLCSEHRDLERFEESFAAVFGDGRVAGTDLHDPGEDIAALGEIPQEVLPRAGAADPTGEEAAPDAEPVPAAWSDIEVLVRKDFARYTEAETVLARDLISRLARRHPMRLSRRTRLSRRRGHAPDLRATVQESLRTVGEPISRRWRTTTERPRQLVLVCDVSCSMTPYARMLLQYMQASVSARRRVEAFAFGTRLTRITQELSGRDPDAALARATDAVTDFSGGTRIGAALAVLNRVHGRRLGRGAVVVVLSDGWDRGEPEQLREEMARLRRTAYRVIWLNPLAAHPDYEPLTRGMQAAVPHTDRLLAGNSIASLEELADVLEAL
jgi:uncharacterized protein with von Willebrand factor type A (vWA) domain